MNHVTRFISFGIGNIDADDAVGPTIFGGRVRAFLRLEMFHRQAPAQGRHSYGQQDADEEPFKSARFFTGHGALVLLPGLGFG